jgi:hypothetical protein
MYFAYATDFLSLQHQGQQLMAPVVARLTPDVIQGGLLTDEVNAALVADDRAAQRFADESGRAADECQRRGEQCRDLREQWQRYHQAMLAYGAAAQAAASSDPPVAMPPPPPPPPPPPSWCQI